MVETRTIATVDEALTRLCQMLTRAVNAPDLPNVRRFLERIDELLEERFEAEAARAYASMIGDDLPRAELLAQQRRASGAP